MSSQSEDFQQVQLLLGVLEFFGSDLPTSKLAAENAAKERWDLEPDLGEEIERLRNYFDEFCVEIGLIEIGLKSYHIIHPSASTIKLSSTTESILSCLESLLNTEPIIPEDKTAATETNSADRFSKIKRLRRYVVSANILGRKLSSIDGLHTGGLIRFSIEHREQERTLKALKNCSAVICDSFQGLPDLTGLNRTISDDNQSDTRVGISRHRLEILGAISRLVNRSVSEHPDLISVGPSPVLVRFLQDASLFAEFQIAYRNENVQREVTNFSYISQTQVKLRGRLVDKDAANETPISSAPTLRLDTISQIAEQIITQSRKSGPSKGTWNFLSGEDELSIENTTHRETSDFQSLRKLLQSRSLSTNQRYLLMVSLSEFVLHLGEFWYECRQVPMVDIFYLPISDGAYDHFDADIARPFLAIHSSKGTTNGDEGTSSHFFHSHRFLLDLGVLLIELQENATIESFKPKNYPQTMYTPYTTAWEFIESPGYRHKVSQSRQAAIGACLRCDFLPHDLKPGQRRFQDLVDQFILQPLKLQEYLDVADEDILDLDNLNFVHLPSAERSSSPGTPITSKEHRPQWKQLGHVLEERLQIIDEVDEFDRRSLLHAKEWMGKFRDYDDQVLTGVVDIIESSKVAGAPQGKRFKRTKVAVIDTGLCFSNPFIAGARDRIKETCNWVPNKKGQVDTFDVKDRVGHGTQVAELLLRIAPGVEVCVARVSDGLLQDANYVAEAINWAVRDCQADIVSMSFGFEKPIEVVQDAILAAYRERKIFFAAASNGGGNEGVAFPADQREVICVLSTDGRGNPSGFNPSIPDDMDGSFFSTLGEAVEVYGPIKSDPASQPLFSKVHKSGTSFATPIAAGIAANILDCVRTKENVSQDTLRRLHTLSGMISVMKLFSQKRSDHIYICPWHLWRKIPNPDRLHQRILIELRHED